MRILILLAKKPDPATDEMAKRNEIPYPEYLALQEKTNAMLWDFHDVEKSSHPLVRMARKQSPHFALAMLGFVNRHSFDHIYCTGEDVAFPMSMLMKSVFDYDRITAVIHNGGRKLGGILFPIIGSRVFRNIICLSDYQQKVLVETAHLPAHKVHCFPQWIDDSFYSPDKSEIKTSSYILSVGKESRDYSTFMKAMKNSPFRAVVVASGWAPHSGFQAADSIHNTENILVESTSLTYPELRDRYAGAKIVVASINSVTYAAGVTSICEGMAMGKPIIATASPGIIDYVKDGTSGFIVPVGNPQAMHDAIDKLWNDEELCAKMGAHNRQWVETSLSTRRFVQRTAGLFGL